MFMTDYAKMHAHAFSPTQYPPKMNSRQ